MSISKNSSYQNLNFDNIQNGILYNQLLNNAFHAYQQKNYQSSLKLYQDILQKTQQTSKKCLIKSVIAVILINQYDLKKAISITKQALAEILNQMVMHDNLQYKTILIKLRSNLALCYIANNQFKNALKQNQEIIKLIKITKGSDKQQLYQLLLYIYYKFTSFTSLNSNQIQENDAKSQNVTQACFYSSISLCNNFRSDKKLAFKYQKKAYEIYKARHQKQFMIMSLKHLIQLGKQINKSQVKNKINIDQYSKEINKIIDSPQCCGITESLISKNFKQKIQCASQITQSLILLEKMIVFDQNQDKNNWVIPLKIRLRKTIKESQLALNLSSQQNIYKYKQSIKHMKHTLHVIQQQNNILILKSIKKSKYVIQSIQYMKGYLNIIKKTSIRYVMRTTFENIQNFVCRSTAFFKGQQKIQKEIKTSRLQLQSKKNKKNINKQIPYQKKLSQIQENDQVLKMQSNLNTPNSSKQNIFNKSKTFKKQNQLDNSKNFKVHYKQNNSKFQYNNFDQMQKNISQRNQFNPNHTQRNKHQLIRYKQQRTFSNSRNLAKTNVQQKNQKLLSRHRQQVSVSKDRSKDKLNISSNSNISRQNLLYSNLPSKGQRLAKYALKKCQLGSYLLKRHFSKNNLGGEKNFVILCKGGYIKWAKDKQSIGKQKKHQYDMRKINGITFGMVSQNFYYKSSNKQFLPWRCFSLYLKTRTLDFVCYQDNSMDWVVGLSVALKKYNPKSFNYSVGRYRWTLMKIKLVYYFIKPMKNNDRVYSHQVAYAIIKFNDNGLKLPQRLFK